MSQIKSMPFPGESPTISLALAAGKQFGLQPEGRKKAARAAPKRKAKSRSARPSKTASRSRTKAKKTRTR